MRSIQEAESRKRTHQLRIVIVLRSEVVALVPPPQRELLYEAAGALAIVCAGSLLSC